MFFNLFFQLRAVFRNDNAALKYLSILTQQYLQPQSNHSDTKDAVDPVADSEKTAADGGLAEKQGDEAKPE